MKTESIPDKKSGGILVIVSVVMLILSVMIAGMFKLQERAALEAVYLKQSMQAFWVAEAGLQDVIQRINFLSAYRSDPAPVSGTFGRGTYEVIVPAVDLDISGSVTRTEYTLESVGTVGGFSRRIREVVSSAPGIKSDIDVGGSGASGHVDFNSNSEVFGSVIVRDGSTIDTGNNPRTTAIYDYLYANESDVSGRGEHELLPVYPGGEPLLDHTIYTDERASISVGPGGIVLTDTVSEDIVLAVSTNFTSNMTFANGNNVTIASGTVISGDGDLVFGGPVTFNGPVTLKTGGNLDLSFVAFNGPVYIEAGGDVTFGNGFLLPSFSTIIARGAVDISGSSSLGIDVKVNAGGNLSMGQQMNLGGNSVYYAYGDLSMAAGGATVLDTETGFGIALLAYGNVDISANMIVFRGIIYGETSVSLNSETEIYGTVVSKGDLTVASNIDFFRDYTVFDTDLARLIGLNLGDVILTMKSWQELSPF